MQTLNFNQPPRKSLSSISVTIALHIIVFGLALQTGRIISEPHSKPVTVTFDDKKPIDPPKPVEMNKPKINLPEQAIIELPKLPDTTSDPTKTITTRAKNSDDTGVRDDNSGGAGTTNGSGDTGAKHVPVHIAAQVDSNACAKPEYPLTSLRNQEEGTVNLAMLIGVDGKVLESKVEKSSGSKALDRAAIAGLSLCKFSAGSTDGVAEKSWAKLQYVWTIN
ncbi:MAG: energy transducer TonB [Burkholderiales bacterium]|nr:energy transducer TonB [Burkholderiales bacterium]